MVWTVFEANSAIEIVFVENKMNSVLYQDMLADSLLPVTLLITSRDWTFQQYNTSEHISCFYKILDGGELIHPERPSRNPNLNPVEKLWSILSISKRRNHEVPRMSIWIFISVCHTNGRRGSSQGQDEKMLHHMMMGGAKSYFLGMKGVLVPIPIPMQVSLPSISLPQHQFHEGRRR
ncbi:hypothetical protein CEXT_389091 [Caerostris extrusa]|uniref:Transposase n=1 Tax=Caerostris extrusa TaxID=172846 RepID=A0AAV4NU51_CAEEX|nr:hypothetical protein CEXT_389091 [Caerostris extrusa]